VGASGQVAPVTKAPPDHPSLACTNCHGRLEREGDSLACASCASTFPLVDGIPSFCKTEPFYEDYLEEHCPFVRNPPLWKRRILRVLPYWSWREWRFFEEHVPRGARILDLGCARGKEWFSSKASFIAGVDPIAAPLRECAAHYDVVAQAEVTALPFESEAFDVVVTSHVLGHVPFEQKDTAFNEIARVLRPGGLSVNIAETDSRHPFVQLGKSDPELYRANFVDTDGHVGLELPSELLARFRRHGFAITDLRKLESGVIHLRYYGKYLSKGYPEREPRVRRKIARWNRISGNPVLLAAYEIAIGAYNRYVEQRRSSLDDAMFVAVSARKDGLPGRDLREAPRGRAR
jgi:SAM-dependent methyltransferase